MSLVFSTLKTHVLAEAHRSDLTAEVAGFVRKAEGLIRRRLVAYEVTDTIVEADRDADAVYDLDITVLHGVVRAVYDEDGVALTQVGHDELTSIAATEEPLYFAIRGNQIEFRGEPATDATFTLHYFGHPAILSGASDTNNLLTYDEDLYVQGSLFYLYQHTQDLELAKVAIDLFDRCVDDLNEQHSRKLTGARTYNATYNLANFPRRGGY